MTVHHKISYLQFIWFLLLVFFVYCVCCADIPEEIPSANLQHPKHQPQNSDSDIDSKVQPAIPLNGVENSDQLDSSVASLKTDINNKDYSAPNGLESSLPVDVKKPDNNIVSEKGAKNSESTNGDRIVSETAQKNTEIVHNHEVFVEVFVDEVFVAQSHDEDESKSHNTGDDVSVPDAHTASEKKLDMEDAVPTDSKITSDDTNEEIPSFKEFREQKEKEKKDIKKDIIDVIDDAPVEKPKGKLIQKNYADTSCGAKIVDNKKELKNCGTILNNNKDLYAMIPCEGSIWFVVELCDTIQINAIQLANYELFSSSVKEFKVYTSETYPPKEWKHIGTFETTNNREIQKFDIENHGEYSKYVRFEKISFRGKEHFCVLSTYEVLGMSMVDEYEEQQQPQKQDIDPYEKPLDDMTDDPIDNESNDKSLIQGAKETVKNIVDSALNVLGVSKNEDDAKNNASDIKDEPISTSSSADQTVPSKPTEESVIIKVDEMGKEIRKDTEPDRRLKGEEDAPNTDASSPSAPSSDKSEPVKVVAQREPIMEGVDLSEDHSEKPVPSSVAQPDQKKGDPAEVQVVEAVTTEIKADPAENKQQDKQEKIVDSPEKKPEAPEKDSKGVVMTNSPKKNSIFVELDKKIKELEKNLSLSNDYLETLSSRYKRVDNLFKPLEKTLSTVDEAMGNFEERLKRLEVKFDKFELTLNAFIEHMDEMHIKSNTLVTSTNLILFLLLIMLYFIWRMSYKVNQISYCVLDMPLQSKATQVTNQNNPQNDVTLSRKRQKSKVQRDSATVRSRDPSPSNLQTFKSEANLVKKPSLCFEKKKPLESVQMDLIYPQPKSPTLKRRSKHVR